MSCLFFDFSSLVLCCLVGYPERYYVVPVRYYVVPTFLGVLWVLCIVPMVTVGYYRAAGYYGYCVVPTGTGTTVL
jgi:hypothetical protein